MSFATGRNVFLCWANIDSDVEAVYYYIPCRPWISDVTSQKLSPDWHGSYSLLLFEAASLSHCDRSDELMWPDVIYSRRLILPPFKCVLSPDRMLAWPETIKAVPERHPPPGCSFLPSLPRPVPKTSPGELKEAWLPSRSGGQSTRSSCLAHSDWSGWKWIATRDLSFHVSELLWLCLQHGRVQSPLRFGWIRTPNQELNSGLIELTLWQARLILQEKSFHACR